MPELRQTLTKNGVRPVGAKHMLAQLVAEKLSDETFDAFIASRSKRPRIASGEGGPSQATLDLLLVRR